MKRPLVVLLAVLVTGLAFSGCRGDRPADDEIVARVGDEYLTREVVLTLTPESVEGENRDFYVRQIVEQWIENQILAQMARKDGIQFSEMEEWQIDKLKSEILANKFIGTRLPYDIKVTDKEAENYYQENEDQFRRNQNEVHLIHLYFKELDQAVVKEIKQTSALTDVIEKNYLNYQVNQIIERNGDLGYLPESQLRREFQKAIKGEKTGTIYGPIKTGDGFHFLQVMDRQPAGSKRQLSLVRDEIIDRLTVLKRLQMTRNLKEESRKNIEVETFYNNIL